MARRGSGGEMVIGLNGAVVTVREDQPRILTVPGDDDPGSLPFGLFDPFGQPTMELALRTLVSEQAGLDLGYVEQLYTFADRGRHGDGLGGSHVVSVSYLALTRAEPRDGGRESWMGWYDFFPWEDWREGRPAIIGQTIAPLLKKWSGGRAERVDRCGRCFAPEETWDEERVLERYELLYESGLVMEAIRGGKSDVADSGADPDLGREMQHDHRRILATAMSRLRGKLKYHPVVFELMPETFTLYELQRTVEAVLGIVLHKQNFRRLVARQGLVERTGSTTNRMGGRPAVLFCFRRDAR